MGNKLIYFGCLLLGVIAFAVEHLSFGMTSAGAFFLIITGYLIAKDGAIVSSQRMQQAIYQTESEV
ncbi:hypothetical protein [uncultured Microbulbifer sp.]|uniref:hypothetical protein n=1 Tax=uncultured Microbulbifer sp. TaxID=348147 RepID=UPI002612D858|nr:hypothetical protein [uncultured Microbulbifer sp.]